MALVLASCFVTVFGILDGPDTKPGGPTDLTDTLNALISRNESCVYCGGKGMIVRNPLDGYENYSKHHYKVVPATFWVNDIFAPSQLYVTAVTDNVDCPNNGFNGYFDRAPCKSDPNNASVTGGWDYASLAYIIGTKLGDIMPDFDEIQSYDWGWGVFYPTDSNSVDERCRRLADDSGYDCPGGTIPDSDYQFVPNASYIGSGGYTAGSTYAGFEGGGAGCHFNYDGKFVDQMDAWDQYGQNLVMDENCQCNWDLKGDETMFAWEYWVQNWIANAQPKPGMDQVHGWFRYGKAPSYALDVVSCWTGNPRDMINIQNNVYWYKDQWSNQMSPQSDWSKDPRSERVYWGWNEVPINTVDASNASNKDAVFIKLPAAICPVGLGQQDSVSCLTEAAQKWLEKDLDSWVLGGWLTTGKANAGQKPGSDLVWAREYVDSSNNWLREFYCEAWTSPSGKYKVIYDTDTKGSLCYLDTGVGSFDVTA